MFQYIISFNNSEGNQSINFPIPQTNIDITYGLDDKKYIIFSCDFNNNLEKNKYLNNLKKIDLESNFNFNISIVNNETEEIINFVSFPKLYFNEIQENFNLRYIYSNDIKDTTKFQLHLACEIGEANE